MSGAPLDLLAECESHGIRLTLAVNRGLAIDAPRDALTPNLLGRLKVHKTELLAMLRSAPEPSPALPAPTGDAPANAVCHCGSIVWRDVLIHSGQSIRRDCGRCGRFLEFLNWHGTSLDRTASTR